MLQLALPHINVLSKVDLVEKFGLLSFNIDYFCDVLDLSYLLDRINDDPFNKKFKKLNRAMCGIIEDYSLGEGERGRDSRRHRRKHRQKHTEKERYTQTKSLRKTEPLTRFILNPTFPVSFFPLNINDKESALNILRQADKASGYVFGDLEERNLQKLMSSALGAEFEYSKLGLVREKYTKTDEDDDHQGDVVDRDTDSDQVLKNIMDMT